MRVIYILWLRQLKRYFRSRSRVLGSIAQPLLLLLSLGYGLGAVYKAAGQGNYFQYLVPGIMAQTVLFAAMFFGAMVIYDRQFGFLKETLVAPVSRLKIMMGGVLGGATTAVLQGLVVFLISLVLGFRPYNWAMVFISLVFMSLLAISIASFSSGIGSFVEDMQGFQAINQFIIFPLYFLSGALYPLNHVPSWLRIIAEVNPISYTVDALRWSLLGTSRFGILKDSIALGITLIVLVIFGVKSFSRIEA